MNEDDLTDYSEHFAKTKESDALNEGMNINHYNQISPKLVKRQSKDPSQFK
jgi:hypothetical protein